jgi:hypothetical protein
MTDVLRIAKERRARLFAETVRLDEFLRSAETLLQYADGGQAATVDPAPANAARAAEDAQQSAEADAEPQHRGLMRRRS